MSRHTTNKGALRMPVRGVLYRDFSSRGNEIRGGWRRERVWRWCAEITIKGVRHRRRGSDDIALRAWLDAMADARNREIAEAKGLSRPQAEAGATPKSVRECEGRSGRAEPSCPKRAEAVPGTPGAESANRGANLTTAARRTRGERAKSSALGTASPPVSPKRAISFDNGRGA